MLFYSKKITVDRLTMFTVMFNGVYNTVILIFSYANENFIPQLGNSQMNVSVHFVENKNIHVFGFLSKIVCAFYESSIHEMVVNKLNAIERGKIYG